MLSLVPCRFPRGSVKWQALTRSSSYRGMDTVHRILTFISWLSGLCFQSLHHRFIAWTKPDTASLLLGTLIDLSRSKSELVAENARYASTTDHPAATGETACQYQDGPHTPGPADQDSSELETSPRHRSARDEARGGIAKVTSSFGDTSPEPCLPHPRPPLRPWP
jgi:hypothetical protein